MVVVSEVNWVTGQVMQSNNYPSVTSDQGSWVGQCHRNDSLICFARMKVKFPNTQFPNTHISQEPWSGKSVFHFSFGRQKPEGLLIVSLQHISSGCNRTMQHDTGADLCYARQVVCTDP